MIWVSKIPFQHLPAQASFSLISKQFYLKASQHGLCLCHPSLSSRAIKRELRESNDTSGFLSIEVYLYLSDFFRSTTIPEPLPYPLDIYSIQTPLHSRILSHRRLMQTQRDGRPKIVIQSVSLEVVANVAKGPRAEEIRLEASISISDRNLSISSCPN